MLFVIGFAVGEIALSLWRPETVPRLRILPEPAEDTWSDGCNDHTRYWSAKGLIWEYEESQTLADCGPRNL